MKKKLLAALLAAMMVFSLTACGEKEEDSTFILSEADLSQYITLNEDYDVYNVEIDPVDATVEEVEAQINNLILDVVPGSENLQKLVERTIVEGDTVNIDYVGTKDGVAFEGGTSYTSTNLGIGTGQFIPGFEDGLIGKMPGEVVTLDLTFPEDYGKEELDGQAVQFEVTIHYIVPTYKDVTDEVAGELYEGCATVDTLREKVSEDIYNKKYASAVEYGVIEILESKATYAEELPQELKQMSYDNIMNNLSNYATYYGMDLETYVYFTYYQDLETFQNETAWELATYNAKYLLYCQAYANEKGISVTEEELDKELEAYAKYYGYETAEGNFSDEEVDSIKNTLMNLKVVDYIIENANVTIKETVVDDTVVDEVE